MDDTGPSGQSPLLLAFGDSLTAGYGLAQGQAFPDILQGLLARSGSLVRVVNGGVSGDTAGDALARLDEFLTPRPDLAIVALGANDGYQGLPPEVMEANLRAILQRLAGLPLLLAGMRAPLDMGHDYAKRFGAVFPRLAEEFGVELYPNLLEGVLGIPALNLPDGFHPNAAGARRIAENLLPHVLPLALAAEASSR